MHKSDNLNELQFLYVRQAVEFQTALQVNEKQTSIVLLHLNCEY